eukprot:753536-Hanusia_phi.AAC.7
MGSYVGEIDFRGRTCLKLQPLPCSHHHRRLLRLPTGSHTAASCQRENLGLVGCVLAVFRLISQEGCQGISCSLSGEGTT